MHKYAIKTSGANGDSAAVVSGTGKRREESRGERTSGGGAGRKEGLSMERFLDGMHSFDEICTELQMSEKDVLVKMKACGDVHIIHR